MVCAWFQGALEPPDCPTIPIWAGFSRLMVGSPASRHTLWWDSANPAHLKGPAELILNRHQIGRRATQNWQLRFFYYTHILYIGQVLNGMAEIFTCTAWNYLLLLSNPSQLDSLHAYTIDLTLFTPITYLFLSSHF